MTFQRFCRDKGFILIDVVLALTCAATFVALIAGVTLSSRDLFERAQFRSHLLDAYEGKAALESDESIFIEERPYGNHFSQKIVTVGATTSVSSELAKRDDITFIQTQIIPGNMPSSSQVCTPELSNSSVVGSFKYLSQFNKRVTPTKITPRISVQRIDLPVALTLPLTDFEVHHNLLYVSTDSTVATDSDILIFDIRDPAQVKLISSINTGPGISSFAVLGRRIYAAAASTAAQLHVIFINHPEQSQGGLSLESRYQLPPPFATATQPMGSSIFVVGTKVYLGTDKWDGEEFLIVDVFVPSLPVKIGGFEMGGKVNDIAVKNDTAYVASSDEFQFRTLDVSDPAHPRLLASANPSGWQRQEGKVVLVFEDQLFGGRTSGGFNLSRDHELFTWSTSTLSTNISAFDSVDIPNGAYGVVPDKSLLFVISRHLGKEFQIFDHQVSTTTSQVVALPEIPYSMSCDEESLYILARGTPTLYKITFN